MALANFIPEVWSKKLLKVFDKTVVMAKLVNRDYEGEIANAGDVVHVRTFGNIAIQDYTRDSIINFQALTDPMQDLVINQQKYFAFKVDDLDKAQSDTDILEGYAGRAAMAIRDMVDTHLLTHTTNVDAGNIIGTNLAPISLTKTNVYAYITELGETLDEDNIPAEGRNLVIPPKVKTLLLQSEEFTRASSLGDTVVQNGYIGNVAGFAVHVTTNMVPNGSNVLDILAFTPDMISFASQVAQVETVRPYDMFAHAVKGLYLYGSKTFFPKAGAILKVDNASL
ncbi:MAG: P22 phage major capsid protein family protein [Vampirovibrionales bacterium]|nr:P22 phage major capsid protein family protein [Vampirovibrionales bacterium]